MSFEAFCQDAIVWTTQNQLEWADFKAQPIQNSSRAASVNTGIQYSWKLKYVEGEQVLGYEVFAYMKPSKSWVKASNKSDYLLQHEQLHFDITEYHSRKLKEEFEAYKLRPSVKRDLNKIYKTIVRERKSMQHQYDKETQHSINKNAQKKWQEKVDQLLQNPS